MADLALYFLSDPDVGYDFEKANATEAKIVKSAILVSSPANMVMAALKRVKESNGKIARLIMSGHGGPGWIRIGSERLDADAVNTKWPAVFSMLRPISLMTLTSWYELAIAQNRQHC